MSQCKTCSIREFVESLEDSFMMIEALLKDMEEPPCYGIDCDDCDEHDCCCVTIRDKVLKELEAMRFND